MRTHAPRTGASASSRARHGGGGDRDQGRFRPGRSGNPAGRPRGRVSRPRHLPIADAVTAARLSHAGLTPRKIAKLLGAQPAAVEEALAGARKLLQLFAPEFAQHWLEASRNAALDGDHRPAQAALLATKVIDPIAQVYDTGKDAKAVAGVRVEFHNFGFAGLPPTSVTMSAPSSIVTNREKAD